ncbi:MAG: hypothetical protein E6K55_08655 [Gemmatimonadetes bacterium]|nr:MAG: hypothetical protein DMD67_09695 [Gemmatimonadota bacterium]PYO99289.1 MAG: hypothetical protein DMD61_07650 [Gemmatimonadota bacterium]TLY52877.1 MAG: hypothetical protein E6K55_08655 [Gemmatimonadota bacterium]
MRIYALMLGIALTTGYGYAAQVAVSSAGAGHRADTLPAGAVAPVDGRGQVWYGGVLDPITVESERGPVAAKTRVFTRPTVRCTDAVRSHFSAVS